jgi:hypothetical protein
MVSESAVLRRALDFEQPNSRFNSRIALSIVVALFALSSLRWSNLIEGSLSRSSISDLSFRALDQPLAHAKFLLSLDNAEIRENLLALSER